MTDLEKATLRLKCAEPFIITASKVGLGDDTIFSQAEKLYEFCVKTIPEANPGQAIKPQGKK